MATRDTRLMGIVRESTGQDGLPDDQCRCRYRAWHECGSRCSFATRDRPFVHRASRGTSTLSGRDWLLEVPLPVSGIYRHVESARSHFGERDGLDQETDHWAMVAASPPTIRLSSVHASSQPFA